MSAGCVAPGESDTTPSTTHATEDSADESGNLPEDVYLELAQRPRADTSNGTIAVTVEASVYGYDDLHYEDVQLCLYDENGTVVASKSIGTISARASTPEYRRDTYTVKVTGFPKYMTVDHPGLRNDSRVGVDLLIWSPRGDSGERFWNVTKAGLGEYQDRFEFPRSDEPGECG